MARTRNACINCGDTREIVSHGLCSQCYMKRRREDTNPWTPPSDRFASQQRKAQSDGRKALVIILEKLDILEASGLMPKEQIDFIRRVVAYHLELAAAAFKSESDLLAS